MENCEPVDVEGATSWSIIGGWLGWRKVGEGGSSGEAGLEGILKGEEIGERKMTPELVQSSKPGGVRGRKSSSASEMTERQSSQGGNIECN